MDPSMNNVVSPMENTAEETKRVIRLDLGCGNNKKEGFIGVDITAIGTQADLSWDLMKKYPWPYDDGAVEELFCSQFFEHVPAYLRVSFMTEAWRVLKVGGIFTLITPFAWSHRSVQDFTHEWPPIVPESYLYFSRKWREDTGMNHAAYEMKCDFEIENIQMARFEQKDFPDLTFAMTHYVNVVDDMIVRLKRNE